MNMVDTVSADRQWGHMLSATGLQVHKTKPSHSFFMKKVLWGMGHSVFEDKPKCFNDCSPCGKRKKYKPKHVKTWLPD
jgi:hypothetical protein